jgi:hypothetical protein
MFCQKGFVLPKEFGMGHFFTLISYRVFILAAEISADCPGWGCCNCSKNLFVPSGTWLPAAEYMVFDLIGTMPGSVLVFFMHPALNPIDWNSFRLLLRNVDSFVENIYS